MPDGQVVNTIKVMFSLINYVGRYINRAISIDTNNITLYLPQYQERGIESTS